MSRRSATACALVCLAAVIRAQAPPPCAAIPAAAPWTDCTLAVEPSYGPLPTTGVTFTSSDAPTQALFAHATTCEAGNEVIFAPGFTVLVEGGGYRNVWLETQPLGGAMYGVRDLRVAVNNQLIFARTQRQDGRLPGCVQSMGAGVVHPTFSVPGDAARSMLQGFYMASPAVDVAQLMTASGAPPAAAAALLAELQPVFARFDAWLWAERNSSNGVLWLNSTADSGEDNSDKFSSLPSNVIAPPFESIDVMAYAHDGERALARIAVLQGDAAAAAHWAARAATTAASLKARLWRDELGACFDRMRDGAQTYVSSLVHNNVRAMWAGVFDQAMADAFIARHLMNTSEFYTPTPLVSISAADARFKDVKGNNWSGPPQGLTFQRALRALEAYGHHAEALLVGARQKAALLRTGHFPQQINPFTSVPDAGDCYGPMILSFLEYAALTTGIAVRPETATVHFSSISVDGHLPPAFSFTQQLGITTFEVLGSGNGTFTARRNGVLLFECAGSARVVAGYDGVVTGVIGASAQAETVALLLAGASTPLLLHVEPNEEWAIHGTATPTLSRKVPFSPPF